MIFPELDPAGNRTRPPVRAVCAGRRYWHKADIQLLAGNVRFWGESGHQLGRSVISVLAGDLVKRCNGKTLIRSVASMDYAQ
jgi:hypothetical protein